MVIDFPEADETPSQCIALSFSPDFVEESLHYLNTKLMKVRRKALVGEFLAMNFICSNSLPLASATNNL